MSPVSARRTGPVENSHQNTPIRRKIRTTDGKIPPKKTITIKLQTKKERGCTFVRHFWLPLVKIWLLAVAELMNHPSMWPLAPLGPNSHHSHQDYVKICTGSHQLDISLRQDIVENAIVYSLGFELHSYSHFQCFHLVFSTLLLSIYLRKFKNALVCPVCILNSDSDCRRKLAS